MSDSTAGMSGKMSKMKSQQAAMRALLVVALAHLQGADHDDDLVFREMSLTGVSLEGLDLSGAVFRECDLSWVNFRGCELVGTHFVDCDLTGANFRGASLHWSIFCRVKCEFSCDLADAAFCRDKRRETITERLTAKKALA